MSKKYAVCLAIVIFALLNSCNTEKERPLSQIQQASLQNVAPAADKIDSILTIHDDTRIDPYFWMRLTDEQKVAENPDEQTQRVINYLKDENAYTDAVMAHTTGFQEKLYEEIVGRIKQTDESVPYFKNGYWYYTKFVEGQEYQIYCRKKGSLDATEEILLDVNKLAEGQAYFAVGGINISPDNKLMAYSTDNVSRRIYTLRFKNLETGQDLPDVLENTQGDGAWASDNSTYFYTSKNKVSLLSEKIWRHKLSTTQDKDVLIHHEKDPSYYLYVYRSKSDKYIMIAMQSTLSNDFLILPADQPTGKFTQFTARERELEYSIDHYDDKFYIVTNWNALNFRLMETSLSNTSKANWTEVIPHREDVLLSGIEIFKDFLVVNERSGGLTQIRIINHKTKDEHYLEFDEPAYVAYTSVNPEFDTNILRFAYASLATPQSTIDYNMSDRSRELKKQQEVVGGHNPQDYIVERIMAKARDGVEVPVSIVYHKNTHKSPSTPLLLYAYGSYGASMDPSFSSVRLSLLNRGFIYAIAHIRGGQEMGRQWYEDGKMFNKKNTFYDYIDCAKDLISRSYTSPAHLYGLGGSAGGLLMGAVINMAPELFNGIIAAVPFVDVVSTMLDETIPLTTNEFDEWGNPKNKDSYDYMLSYSPYDNIVAKAYPNILVTTGLFDSQVQYWEPAKWVARLREKKTDNNVLLLKTNMEAGHGGASGRFRRYRETALEYAFFLDLEGITDALPLKD